MITITHIKRLGLTRV